MPWPAIIGAIVGGVIASKGAGDAADAQQDAAEAAAKVQWDMYVQSRADQAPWREGGADAVNQLRQMLGLSYYRPVADPNALTLTPDANGTYSQPTNQLALPPIAPSLGAPPTAPAPGTTAAPGGVDPNARYAELQAELAQLRWINDNMTEKTRDNQGLKPTAHIEQELRDIELARLGLPQAPTTDPRYPGTAPTPRDTHYTPTGTGTTPGAGTDPGQAPPVYELVQGSGEQQMGEFTESPGYRFTLQEGLNAQQNALSAMGQNRSGKHLKAATQYAEGLASTEYDNFLARWYQSLTPYQSLAGLGQTSVQNTGNLGASAAGNIGQANILGGLASGAGSINQANALTGAITGGANQLLYYNSLRNLQQPSYQQYETGTPNLTGRPVDQWQYSG